MFITTATGAPPGPLRRGLYLRISRSRLLLFALLLAGSWYGIFHWAMTKPLRAASAPSGTVSTSAPAASQPSTTGPWGELEITPIDLEPPADAATRFATVDTTTWHFRDCDSARLAQILQTTGVSESQRDGILKSCVIEPVSNGLAAKPDPAIVLALSPAARSNLYQLLAADPRNPQAEPFRHSLNQADDWFADTGLPSDTLAVVRSLIYRRGEMEAFVDVSVILPYLKSDSDRAALFRALSAQSALLVELRVRPHSDVHALVKYWGVGGRERQVGPLLESLARLPEPSPINVAQLLPQFARARVYTFPQLEGTTPNGPFDCHWTSFNFWNRLPEDQFTNAEYVRNHIGSAYHTIDRADQLGDVILLVNSKGDGIHSATYVADGIVFTKNGSSMSAPWIFMKLSDLVTYYETNGVVKTLVLRKNEL
jgi:hypothetical protein